MKTRDLIFCSFFAALTAVFSQILLPLPFSPVPVNLTLLAPRLAGQLLGMKRGIISQILYVLLGLFGLPVFTGFSGGPGVLFGPTGGYIMGYILAAGISGRKILPKSKRIIAGLLQMAGGLLACYLLGALWFALVTERGLYESLMLCILPFLPGDALKILACSYLAKKLRPIFGNWE